MPICYDCAQYSEEYDRLRMGIPTSSNFDKIITPGGKPSKQWEKYAYKLIAERIVDRKIDTYSSRDMELGLMMEEDAALDYELQNNCKLERIGFVTNDAGTVGCSPDRRIVGENGGVEIKCPIESTQVEYLLTGKIDRDYWPQLQGQLYVCEWDFVDIIAYHPELPRATMRIERDVEFIACLESELHKFNGYITEVMRKIISMQPLRKGSKFETINF